MREPELKAMPGPHVVSWELLDKKVCDSAARGCGYSTSCFRAYGRCKCGRAVSYEVVDITIIQVDIEIPANTDFQLRRDLTRPLRLDERRDLQKLLECRVGDLREVVSDALIYPWPLKAKHHGELV